MDFEAALREACIEADKTYWKSFFEHIDSMPVILIPEEKDKRLRDFIRNYEITSVGKKNHKGVKQCLKALLIAAIILLALAITTFAFKPMRNYVFHIFNNYTEFIFNDEKDADRDFFSADYLYIPEGYELVSKEKSKHLQRLLYTNGGNQIVIRSVLNINNLVEIDTEDAETGEIEIGGKIGYYSCNEKVIIVMWSTGQYYHQIIADTCNLVSLDDVIQIAQSAKPKR